MSFGFIPYFIAAFTSSSILGSSEDMVPFRIKAFKNGQGVKEVTLLGQVASPEFSLDSTRRSHESLPAQAGLGKDNGKNNVDNRTNSLMFFMSQFLFL